MIQVFLYAAYSLVYVWGNWLCFITCPTSDSLFLVSHGEALQQEFCSLQLCWYCNDICTSCLLWLNGIKFFRKQSNAYFCLKVCTLSLFCDCYTGTPHIHNSCHAEKASLERNSYLHKLVTHCLRTRSHENVKTLYQTDWYTPMHITDLVVLQWITICMRVVHTEESIVTNSFSHYIYAKFMHND